jgi:N-acetylglutamate synthase-like GNAT family acetyltransferase
LIVREASRDDFENLAHLVTELGYPSSTEDMGRRFEGISADPSYATLVAEGEGKVLGMVGLYGPCTQSASVPTLTAVAVK